MQKLLVLVLNTII